MNTSKSTQFFEAQETLVDELYERAHLEGFLMNDRYDLTIGPRCGGDNREPTDIVVRDRHTLMTVAFSSMRTDYQSSLREFVEDYFA